VNAALGERLRRQRLWGGALGDAAAVVRWLGAVQAQDFGAAKWAVGLRLAGGTEAEVARAYDAGQILRTHVLRPTWHFVASEDIRWMLRLTAPRVLAQCKSQYKRLGLTDAVFARAEAVVREVLAGGHTLTRAEISAELTAAGVNLDTPPGFGAISSHLMMHAELAGLVCNGPMRGKQFTYALLDEWAPAAAAVAPADPVPELARRYLQSRAPASLADFVWWSGLTAGEARAGFEAAASELPPVPAAPAGPLPAYLLPNYDEYLVAYADRSLMAGDIPPDQLGARGNALFQNTIISDGRVVGTWQKTLKAKSAELHLRPFQPLTPAESAGVEQAARRYAGFLEVPVAIG
jgi:hypothetical protein